MNSPTTSTLTAGRACWWQKASLFGAALVLVGTLQAQTGIPASDGGFENGTSTFAANGWSSSLPGTARDWRVGTIAGAATGTKAAYTGNATTYNGVPASVTYGYFWRDVVIPPGVTNVFLNYKLKVPTIDNGGDYFDVYTTTTANTPAAGVDVFGTAGYTNRQDYTSPALANFTAQPQVNLTALAGTTVRIVFEYSSDGISPHANYAVDDVTLNWTCSGTAPGVSASNNSPLCAGTTLNLTGNITSGSATTFSWSGPNGFTSAAQNPAIPSASGGQVGIYTFTASNGIGSCSATTTTTVATVNPAPSAGTASASASTACTGGTVNLTGGFNTGGTLLSSNFNSGAGGWTTTNTSTGGTPANAAWTLRANGYSPGGSFTGSFNSNDASQFYLSNSDAQGSGSTTNTTLISPVFSTVGLATVSLNFFHHFRFAAAPDAGFVDVSTDGGTNWTNVQSYTATVGTQTAFASATINLNAFHGSANTRVRFRYTAAWGWCWAIDNVTITGANPTLTYAWTSTPAGYSSTAQSPTGAPVPSTRTFTFVASTVNGCSTSATTSTVTALPLPTATLAGNGPFCASGSPQLTGTLTGTGPWSITYTTNGGSPTTVSGIAASPYTINPTGPITSTTTYAITAISNATCSATSFPASVNVVVNPLPVVTCGTYGPACVDAADITLGGSPSGGTWTGTGVSAGVFDPSVGTQTVTYSYTDGNSCTNSCQTTITVNPLPVVTCGTYGPVCVDAADIALGGSPTGGTWSGTGVTGNSFDPSVGTQTVTYSFTDGNGCTNSCQTTITVNPLPVVTCGTYGPVCVDAPDITLGGSPTGGTWSGTGVTAGAFDPSVGTQTVTYSYTDGNGCTNSCTTTITVNPLPVVTCGTYGPVCVDAADITLGGSPTGGTWSGTGVTAGVFDPSVGTQTVQYDYTDGNGCSASCSTTITVNPLPVVTCPADISGLCSVDAAFALAGNGENPTGGTFSGPGVSGGNFDPAVAGGGTHTITYSYTDGNTCSNTCTFTISVTAATTWYGDLVDGDGLGDPAVTLDACTQPVGYVANSDDACPTENGTVGSTCDDGNCFTVGDVLDNDCVCTGTLVPCDNWTLTINAGTNGGEISWQITEDGGPCVLASGGGYSNGSTNNVNVCVPQGNCFRLTFNDAGNNGITGGGWVLTDNNGRRIVDNMDNGACFGTTTTSAAAFCNEPTSAQTVIPIHCDKENWIITNTIIASADPAVSAQWGIGNQADDGYQFWFTSSCGTYSRQIFRNHATSGGQGPANAIRATKLALSTIVSSPLPVGELLNVRVRSRVNGVNGAWGPACRFRLDPTACTITKLNSTISSPNFSCGATGKVVGAGGNTGKIFADVVTSGGNPATHYRFEFSVPGEGYLRNAVSTNAACLLGVWQTYPLLCGTYTYDVRVQASFNGGVSYCPYGEVCQVTITNNQPLPYCTSTNSAMAPQDEDVDNFDGGDFVMYPNPNRGDQLFVSMTGFSKEVAIVTVDVFDSFGKRAMTATLPVQDGFLNTALELAPDMAAGLYMVNVTAGDNTRTERLVIQR